MANDGSENFSLTRKLLMKIAYPVLPKKEKGESTAIELRNE
jgi:hypothetical protein